jgi:hypothetical protein
MNARAAFKAEHRYLRRRLTGIWDRDDRQRFLQDAAAARWSGPRRAARSAAARSIIAWRQK